MLNYNEFKKVVVERIREFLPEELKYVELTEEVTNTLKRGESEVLVLRGKTKVNPSGHFKDMYSIYEKNSDLEETLQIIAQLYVTAVENAPKEDALDTAKAKDNIVFKLMNTERNKDYLSSAPHRAFLDLSIGYIWIVGFEKDKLGAVLISDTLATKLELTEQELYELAKENTTRLMQPEFRPMENVMQEIMKDFGIAESPEDMVDVENDMWVITSNTAILGAAAMLYDKTLSELGNTLDSNYYILPSSLHELIAIPENGNCPTVEELKEMVKDVNKEAVDLDEQLSDNVYYYCRESKTVSIAGGK